MFVPVLKKLDISARRGTVKTFGRRTALMSIIIPYEILMIF